MKPSNYQSDANELLLDLDTPSYHAYSIKEAGIDLESIKNETKTSADIQLKSNTPSGCDLDKTYTPGRA